MSNLDTDWYTYLTEDFKLDRECYRSADKTVVDCPKCGGTDCVRLGHLKSKIRKLGYYECSTCRKKASIHRARKACADKYGGKNPFQLDSVKAKIKKTNLDRHGVACILEKPDVREKGVAAAASKESRQKAMKTFRKTTGFDNPLDYNRDRIKRTFKERSRKLKDSILPQVIKTLKTSNLDISNINFYKRFGVSYTTIISWLREEGHEEYIKPLTLESALGVASAKEAGLEIAAYIESAKLPALCSTVCDRFKISAPTVKKALYAASREDLIGRFQSAKQQALAEFITNLGFEITINDRSAISPKELDIYIPDKNLAIEFNGLYWHSEERLDDRKAHQKKLQKCLERDIDLIQINEDEWDSKQAIVKSILKAKLNLFDRRVYARKCNIREISPKEHYTFCEENHLMGGFRQAKGLGLFFKEELVAVLTYRKYKQSDIEISRFCSKLGTQIMGGLGKIVKYLERGIEFENLVSYVDLRYGNGHSLNKLGFEKKGETLGWKWTDFDNTFNRRRCRANMDERKLSEAEYAEELGWVRIYDAGQAKFVKKKGGESKPSS